MKRSFTLKCELCSKSFDTEAIFTKTDINNEWNVNFLQNVGSVPKVLRPKLYLPDWNR